MEGDFFILILILSLCGQSEAHAVLFPYMNILYTTGVRRGCSLVVVLGQNRRKNGLKQ